jgi:FHA domain-containing protein
MTLVLRAVTLNEEPISKPLIGRFDERGGTVGRSDEATLTLPDAERMISRVQAQVIHQDGKYWLENLSAVTPILHNGRALSTGMRVVLQEGDEIRIVGYVLEAGFEDDPESATLLRGRTVVPRVQSPPPVPRPSRAPSPQSPTPAYTPAPAAEPAAPARGPNAPMRTPASPSPTPAYVPAPAAEPGAPARGPNAPGRTPPPRFAEPAPPVRTPPQFDDSAPPLRTPPPQFAEPVPPVRTPSPPFAAPGARSPPPLPAASAPPPVPDFAATGTLPASAAVAAHGQGAGSSDNALWKHLLDGAEVELNLPQGPTPDLLHTIGEMLNIAVGGLLRLISMRASVKNEMQARMTMIQVRDNNPLKFSPDATLALQMMLQPQARGFLNGPEALRDAFTDLQAHQIGMAAGMRSVVDALLERLDPSKVQSQSGSGSLLDKIMPSRRRARLWDQYVKEYAALREEALDGSQRFIADSLRKAYEAQVSNLATSYERSEPDLADRDDDRTPPARPRR